MITDQPYEPTPYTEAEWKEINTWWFDGGAPPKIIMTTERWIMTVKQLHSQLKSFERIS